MQRPSNYLKEDLSQKASHVYALANVEFNDFKMNPSSWQDFSNNATANPYGPDSKKIYRKKDDITGREYEIWVDEKNDVNTLILVGNDADKKIGIVGTDGRAVFKQFGDKAYDYVKVDDYIDRQLLIFKAAIKLARNDSSLIANIIQYQETVLKAIREKCQFDNNNHDIRKPNPESAEKFNASLDAAKEIMENSLIDLAYLSLSQLENKELDKKKIEAYLHDVKLAEIDVIREQGRPFIIKTNNIGNQKMVSAQFPLGSKTIPSSDRSGHHTQKLSNHVRDGSGIIDSKGKIEMEVVIDGHSSYPPIGEMDERKRRLITYLAFEEKVKQLVLDKTNAGDVNSPLKISIATMMMLTPLVHKKIEQIARGRESETNQLSDTQYAINMFLAQPKPLTIEIERNGKREKVFVEVDMNLMNLPVNAGKKMQKASHNIIQQSINIKGFNKFTENTLNYLRNNHDQTITDTIKLFDEQTKEIQIIKNKIKPINDQLNQEYVLLKACIDKSNLEPNNKNLLKEYNDRRRTIQTLEDKINNYYLDINNIAKTYYEKNKDNYNKAITDIRTRLKNLHDPSASDRKPLTVLLRFLEAQKIFSEELYLRRKHAYQFHINFVLANEIMGKDVEAFCKSAEDRTGWLRVSLLANLTFEKIYGYPPDLNNEKERNEYFGIIAAKALELSASIENNKYNSEARSLQVSQQFTNPLYNMQSGNLLSKLAKDVFPQLNRSLRHPIGIPNRMMEKIQKQSGPSTLLNNLNLSKGPVLKLNANGIKLPTTNQPPLNSLSSEDNWEKKRLFRSSHSVNWEVTKSASGDSSTLVVKDMKNIEKGLLSHYSIFYKNKNEQAQVDLVAKMVEAVTAPLKEAGFNKIIITTNVPKELEKLEPVIRAYCRLKGYEYKSNTLNDIDKTVSEKKLKKVETKYDINYSNKMMQPTSTSMLKRVFTWLKKPRTLLNKNQDKTNVAAKDQDKINKVNSSKH